MPDGLHDENRPPSAVVEIAANNEARRNDGTVLSSSGENPWYVLATVAGEQRAGGNVAPSRALHARNRRIWNGWICKDLPVTERAKLAEKLGWSELDFAPLNAAEMKLLTARFQAAFGVQDITAVLPDPKSNIDFSSLFFPCIVFLNQFYFPNKVDFSTSNFAGPAIFEGAYFEDEVDFRKTHFQSAAALVSAHVSGAALFAETYFEANSVFKDTRFNDYAVFQKAHFQDNADFTNTSFASYALFDSARFVQEPFFESTNFLGKAGFSGTFFGNGASFLASKFLGSQQFDGMADFSSAQFEGRVDFSNSQITSTAIFTEAHFKTVVPTFFDCEISQGVNFSDNKHLWPSNFASGKKAYVRLRQIAGAHQDHDLEHFFFRQEMRCKEELAVGSDRFFIAGYRWLSDYGISIARPMVGIAVVIIIGWYVIGFHLKHSEELQSASPLIEALGISVGNTLPFLGVIRTMHPNFHANAPAWIDAFSVLQSVVGIVLLFLLGLGLRNRLRMK